MIVDLSIPYLPFQPPASPAPPALPLPVSPEPPTEAQRVKQPNQYSRKRSSGDRTPQREKYAESTLAGSSSSQPHVDPHATPAVVLPTLYRIYFDKKVVRQLVEKNERKGFLTLNPDLLQWTPFIFTRIVPDPAVPGVVEAPPAAIGTPVRASVVARSIPMTGSRDSLFGFLSEAERRAATAAADESSALLAQIDQLLPQPVKSIAPFPSLAPPRSAQLDRVARGSSSGVPHVTPSSSKRSASPATLFPSPSLGRALEFSPKGALGSRRSGVNTPVALAPDRLPMVQPALLAPALAALGSGVPMGSSEVPVVNGASASHAFGSEGLLDSSPLLLANVDLPNPAAAATLSNGLGAAKQGVSKVVALEHDPDRMDLDSPVLPCSTSTLPRVGAALFAPPTVPMVRLDMMLVPSNGTEEDEEDEEQERAAVALELRKGLVSY